MFKNCTNCNQDFEINDGDLKFYEKVSPIFNGNKYLIPTPVLCPDYRQQRRLCFRNERNLYKRKCNLCNKSIISIYSPDKNYKVYCTDCFWSDKWDAMSYGREFDFNRDFFEQLMKLDKEVPKIALYVMGDNINSDFTHNNYKLKNCYLVFDGEQAVDSYYGETFTLLKDCMDFQYLFESELCYECLNSKNLYDCKFCSFSINCSNSWFLMDCIGCTNCFGSINLRNKEYYIFNEPYSKEDYLQKIKSFNLDSFESLENFKQSTKEFFLKFPRKDTRSIMCENVSGDNLTNCKDTFNSFDCKDARDCKFCTNIQMSTSDCYDIDTWGDNLSLAYNCECIGGGAQNIICSLIAALDANNILYSIYCTRGVSNLFGCIALQKKNYCILNKQYTKEEYEDLVAKIIEHMIFKNQWCEFFPSYLSQFGYNETVAQDYFPLSKEEAISKGFKWSDYEPEIPEVEKIIPANLLPDKISDVPDDILNWAVECEITGKPFKIIKPELEFYRKMNLPIPRKHPDQRHKDRFALRNPRKLFDRKCMKCGLAIKTTYGPDRPEIVYCEKCYLESVY